jgi:hypothetical protein
MITYSSRVVRAEGEKHVNIFFESFIFTHSKHRKRAFNFLTRGFGSEILKPIRSEHRTETNGSLFPFSLYTFIAFCLGARTTLPLTLDRL